MNINKDTKIRIRVPKSLYESIQQEIKKEGTKQEEFGQYHGKQAMKPGIANENEDQMNEADVQGYVDAIKTALDPETLMWLAGVIGTTGAGAWIGKALQKRSDSGEGNPTLDKTMRTNEASKKPHGKEEVVQELSMEQLSEAIKKAKAKKAKEKADKEKAAKEKEKAAAAKAKEKAAAAKKK